jgi:hypothetical protein
MPLKTWEGLKSMHAFQAALVVLLALATNALYIQGQWIFHHHRRGWRRACWSMVKEHWQVTGGAILIIIIFVLVNSIWP